MQLNDIVAVSGLLLTLITFLFNLAWPKITEALNQDEATSGDKERAKCKTKIRATLFRIVVPILIAFFVLFYINLPTAFNIIRASEFAIWDFDVDDTLYVMVVYALLAFVVFNIRLVWQLHCKAEKFK